MRSLIRRDANVIQSLFGRVYELQYYDFIPSVVVQVSACPSHIQHRAAEVAGA